MSALVQRRFTLTRLFFVAVMLSLLASICVPLFLHPDNGSNPSAMQEIAYREKHRRKMAPPGLQIEVV